MRAADGIDDRRARRFEGARGGRFDFFHLNHVEALAGLDRRADVAGAEREERLLERLHHDAARNPSELAALVARVGIDAALARELCEVGALLERGADGVR